MSWGGSLMLRYVPHTTHSSHPAHCTPYKNTADNPRPTQVFYHTPYYLSMVIVRLMYYIYLSRCVKIPGWVRGWASYSLCCDEHGPPSHPVKYSLYWQIILWSRSHCLHIYIVPLCDVCTTIICQGMLHYQGGSGATLALTLALVHPTLQLPVLVLY